MRAVVAQMAGLAEGAEIAQPVVGGIVVEVRGGEDDAGGAEADRVEQGGPAAGRPRRSRQVFAPTSNQRPSGRQRRFARCGRPQVWH